MQQVEGNENNDSEEEETKWPIDCCLHHILSLQEDFGWEKSLLEKVSAENFTIYFLTTLQMITDADNVCHFLPKFHPEMNPIEYVRAWAKHYFRDCLNGNFKTAQKSGRMH